MKGDPLKTGERKGYRGRRRKKESRAVLPCSGLRTGRGRRGRREGRTLARRPSRRTQSRPASSGERGDPFSVLSCSRNGLRKQGYRSGKALPEIPTSPGSPLRAQIMLPDAPYDPSGKTEGGAVLPVPEDVLPNLLLPKRDVRLRHAEMDRTFMPQTSFHEDGYPQRMDDDVRATRKGADVITEGTARSITNEPTQEELRLCALTPYLGH